MLRLTYLAPVLAACGSVEAEISDAPAASFTVSIAPRGAGAGLVSSAPAGIVCGTDCAASFPAGTIVSLTATPSGDSTFLGWTGGVCSGTGSCTVAINRDLSVVPEFALGIERKLLTVVSAGDGQGVVTSNPAGITCGADCNIIDIGGGNTSGTYGHRPCRCQPGRYLRDHQDWHHHPRRRRLPGPDGRLGLRGTG